MSRAGMWLERFAALVLLMALLEGCAAVHETRATAQAFTVAVVSDTQNYVDFRRQRATGYPFDGREMFLDQMEFIARNTQGLGGDIAFVTAVGDLRQTASRPMDEAHARRGLSRDATHAISRGIDPRGAVEEYEVVRRGYESIAGKVPFSVVPGNHDYDAAWSDGRPIEPPGQLHYGGLQDFTAVFGARSGFFRDSGWYVDHFNGGADSAQVFEAGGYRFLHIGLEMAPEDDVLEWAEGVMRKHAGLPTIITTHDYLNPRGERKAVEHVDFDKVHPEHNSPEELWQKLISRHRQIFLVLSGHQGGQARRVDSGEQGGLVWQILSDYQNRSQSLLTANPDGNRKGMGDGWIRLMTFDLNARMPVVRVRTYSTHYHAFASDLPRYAQWYKPEEQPQMTDAEFLAQDEFTLELADFRERFGEPTR